MAMATSKKCKERLGDMAAPFLLNIAPIVASKLLLWATSRAIYQIILLWLAGSYNHKRGHTMRLITLSFCVWLLTACSLQPHGQSEGSEPQLERLSFTSALDGSERQFFVYLPRGYETQTGKDWPVLLFLHGNGERGNGRDELDYVLAHGPLYEAWIQKRDLPFIMIVPQLPMFGMDEHADYLRNRDPSQIPQRLADGVPPRPADFPTPEPMNGVPAPA
tara:strand:+ start:28 stop:684 length:657 start_codon:yes stop_codon:yes gene_type:complete